MAVSVEEWENASCSLPVVFNFFSGAEQGKHFWDEAEDQVPCLPCSCGLDPDTKLLGDNFTAFLYPWMLHSVFQLIRSMWEQLKEQPDPSQCYFEALGFLATGYAVIPPIQENMWGYVHEKTGDS